MISAVVHGPCRLDHTPTGVLCDLNQCGDVLLDLSVANASLTEHSRRVSQDMRRQPQCKLSSVIGHTDAVGRGVIGRRR